MITNIDMYKQLKRLKRKWFPDAVIEFEHRVIDMDADDTFNISFEDNKEPYTLSFKILSRNVVQCQFVCTNPTRIKTVTIHTKPSITRYWRYWLNR